LHRGLGFGFCYVDSLYQRAREETEAMSKRREGGEKGRKEKERRVHNARPKAEQNAGVDLEDRIAMMERKIDRCSCGCQCWS
jgi:hypothetical protein